MTLNDFTIQARAPLGPYLVCRVCKWTDTINYSSLGRVIDTALEHAQHNHHEDLQREGS